MNKRLTKDAFITALPVFLAVLPFIVSVLLFVVALLLIELSGGSGVKQPSSIQEVLQTVGDLSAGLAYLTFTIITPIGIITAIAVTLWRFVQKRLY